MLALPDGVIGQLQGLINPHIARWTLDPSEHNALLEALGRALASSDTDGFVAKKRLAFASADDITYPASGAEAATLMAEYTAVVQRLERTDLVFAKIVAAFSRHLNRAVSISAYIAGVNSRAFSWHVDKWDSVIIQLQGRKAFDVRVQATNELSPGDAMFLPQDVRHRARTLERSVHLSVVFFRR